MPTYLEVAVNVPQVAGVFHYHLPPELEGRVGIGQLVVVPFGKQRVQGVALRLVDSPAVNETRPVLEVLDPLPVLTPAQLALAQSLSESSLAPLAACLDVMLPPGLSKQAETVYTLQALPASDGSPAGQTEFQERFLKLLKTRGPLRSRQIDRVFSRFEWRGAVQPLVRSGLVSTHSILPPPTVQPKYVRTAQLAVMPQQAEAELGSMGRTTAQALERRRSILVFLAQEAAPVDVAWVYAETGGNLSDLQYLAEHGLVTLGDTEVWRDPLEGVEAQPYRPPVLTQAQAAAWDQVQTLIQQAATGRCVPPVLLHGVTGSGKTEIYLRSVEETIHQGRQAIILVPEIALTPQTVRRFVSRFPGQVGVLHSRLSEGERYDTWRRARAGLISVIIGPRSALFAPLPRVGLIVLDEFHDDSYYQSEHAPHYHARQAALSYASLTCSVCILGSATPDIATFYRFQQGEGICLSLPNRVLAHREPADVTAGSSSPAGPLLTDLPPVKLVDMRQELKTGNRSIFSRALQAALTEVLARQEQAILFLNRRGSATYVFCRDCGYVLKCPRCDLPLTYHSPPAGQPDQPMPGMLCHYCGYQRKMPSVCPECRSAHIRQYGAGTEKVEADVLAQFPGVRTLRWDFSTTQKKGAHEILLSHFASHQADVLIGTQMLAKGLDLPLVTLVGVVLADVGIALPDFRAAERTFSILAQVAGRAGRSSRGGRVILQTFQPDHYAIRAASQHDYQAFYDEELAYRRRLGYPPFSQWVRLEYRHHDPAQAERAAKALAAQIRHWAESEGRQATTLIGPAPCFFARIDGQYRWQIILRGPSPVSLLRNRALSDWRVEVNPPSLL